MDPFLATTQTCLIEEQLHNVPATIIYDTG